MELNESYWTQRYLSDQTGWDIGYAAPAITHFMEQVEDKSLSILIPGCGNAYEAAYLWKNGFKNVYLLDLSELPLKKFAIENPDFPQEQLLQLDFFDLDRSFDIVIEQTFFCALNPKLRAKYVVKMNEIITLGGCLTGLLFNDPLFDDHPPFGGDKEEYTNLFKEQFNVLKMETAYNSIPQREGRELFILMQPKKRS